MKRENGYYFVRNKMGWQIAEWYRDSWCIIGMDKEFIDPEFEEIDERRVVRERNPRHKV